jgi:hypothetical protein
MIGTVPLLFHMPYDMKREDLAFIHEMWRGDIGWIHLAPVTVSW